MHQRFTSHVSTGVGLPHSLDEQSHDLVPNLGSALFAGAAKSATALARRELARVLRQVHVKADKELKRQVTDWFVVERLIDSLSTEAKQRLPAHSKPLAGSRLRVDDGWGALAVLGAWQLRECITTRVSPQNMPPTPKMAARKLSRKRSRVPRKVILSLVHTYEQTRTLSTGAFDEHQRNDPLRKFHNAVCQLIAKHQAATPKTYPSLVRTDIAKVEWPKHSAFFLSIPFESRLALALSMLLRLRADHTVWTHRLEFSIEPLLREIVREARRSELARRVANMNNVDLAAFASAVRETCVYGTRMEISTLLMVATSSFALPDELLERVQTAAERHVQISADELRALVTAGDANAFNVAAHALSSRWLLAIADYLRGLPAAPENLDFVEAPAHEPAHVTDGDTMMGFLLASLPPSVATSVAGAGNDLAALRAATAAAVTKHFGAPPTWTVALPIANWSVEAQPAPPVTPSMALMTVGEIESTWKPARELAPASPSAGHHVELTKSSLCLVADDIVAPDAHLAVREAQSRLDATLCGIWFLDARDYRAQLSKDAFARGIRDGRIMRVRIEPTLLRPQRRVRAEELSPLLEIASTLTSRWVDPHQRDLWRRVSEGMGFLRSALSATLFYERYLFLWMALEALLNNLATDEEKQYADAVPIGTRVAYRASLILVPDASMVGKTYGDARWVTTLELGTLYHLRNKAVHEGRRNPPMDEILLDRFQRRVISVFETISHNAFRYGMTRVEELLAWCESKFPSTDVIPST